MVHGGWRGVALAGAHTRRVRFDTIAAVLRLLIAALALSELPRSRTSGTQYLYRNHISADAQFYSKS